MRMSYRSFAEFNFSRVAVSSDANKTHGIRSIVTRLSLDVEVVLPRNTTHPKE